MLQLEKIDTSVFDQGDEDQDPVLREKQVTSQTQAREVEDMEGQNANFLFSLGESSGK